MTAALNAVATSIERHQAAIQQIITGDRVLADDDFRLLVTESLTLAAVAYGIESGLCEWLAQPGEKTAAQFVERFGSRLSAMRAGLVGIGRVVNGKGDS